MVFFYILNKVIFRVLCIVTFSKKIEVFQEIRRVLVVRLIESFLAFVDFYPHGSAERRIYQINMVPCSSFPLYQDSLPWWIRKDFHLKQEFQE